MNRDVARREVLLLGSARWTGLWEPVVRLHELAPDSPTDALAEVARDVLRALSDSGQIKFERADPRGPTGESRRHRLRRETVAAALDATFLQTAGDVWYATTRTGDRELADLLGVKLAGRRRKTFALVVAGFGAAVKDMTLRRRRLSRRDLDDVEGLDGPLEGDDDAGLAGSGLPRRPPDRSGSGVALATPEPGYEFERVEPPRLER